MATDWKYVKSIAETIFSQIKATVEAPVFWSWGVSKVMYSTNDDMPALMLRVSGALFKGWVYVVYNEGLDTYIVKLVTVRHVVKKVVEDVYFDELGSLIDSLVERPCNATDEQYHKLAMADSAKKFK